MVPAFNLELLKEFLNVSLRSCERRHRLDALRTDVGLEKRSGYTMLTVELLTRTTLEGPLDQVVTQVARESKCELLT